MAKNAKNIVKMCGNDREPLDGFKDSGQIMEIFQEITCGMEFYASECDARSFNTPSDETNRKLGQIYNHNGCMCQPASSEWRDKQGGTIQTLQSWFDLDHDRQHINERLNRKGHLEGRGAPRFYMFKDLVHFKAEIEGWVRNQKTGKPVDKDDHLISCALFLIARHRPYMGAWNLDKVKVKRRKAMGTNY